MHSRRFRVLLVAVSLLGLASVSIPYAVANSTASSSASVSVTKAASAAAQQAPQPDPPSPNELLKQLGISGYADPLSAQPGDTVRFRVSSESPTFHATIVRVIHGDPDPRGPGIKEQVVSTPVNRDYPGRHHDLPVGSYVTVPDKPALRLTSSFTITAWIAPTTIPGSTLNPLAFHRSPAGTPRPQGILTKWSDAAGTGYGLFIDQDGSLALWLGSSGGRVEKIRTGVPMHPWDPAQPGFYAMGGIVPQMTNARWYFVAASYDAQTGKVRLVQEPLAQPPDTRAELPDPTRVTVQRSTSIQSLGQNPVSLLTAAYWTKSNQVGGFYNGKIDNPRLYDRALSPAAITAIRNRAGPNGALASWDFSRRMSTTQVVDISQRHLNGHTVNLPVRALTGHNWTRKQMDWTRAPSQYGAMWFHEDSLGNSRWPVSFKFKIPDNLRSGYYAAKLQTANNKQYYVSFFVRPKQGRSTAKIAFLVPLFSYLAYGVTGPTEFSNTALSQYSRYEDGGGVFYSSRLRPISNMQSQATGTAAEPRAHGTPWQYEADTHIVDWLESNGFQVDYFTDQDLHREGAKLLKPYKVVLTGSHPEYISENILNALQKYLDNGGRLMYLGGNGFYWIDVPDPTGTFTEMRRHDGTEAWQAAPGEYYHGLTGEFGGLWRFRGRPPNELVGTGFTAQGFGAVTGSANYSRPYTRNPDSFDSRAAFIFQGVGPNEQIGNFPSLQLRGGAAGEELDRFDYSLNSPPTTLVLATASGFGNDYLWVVEEINNTTNVSTTGNGGQPPNPLVRSDMTLSYYPKGGAAFSVSSISYTGSLFFNHYNNNVSRITGNVLRTFMSSAPLPGAPRGD
jgi:N,N-dimethylformamidase